MNKNILLAMALLGSGLTPGYSAEQQPCGNDATPTGESPDTSTDDPVNINTGNDFRTNHDLKVYGGVGEHALEFTRYYNSRTTDGANNFCVTGMRHGYQWEMGDAGVNSSNQALMTIVYPDGASHTFTQTTATKWASGPKVTDTMTQQGNAFTLQRANGWKYNFSKMTDSVSGGVYYQMSHFKDSQQNTYNFAYDAGNRVVQVLEPAGRSLQMSYQNLPATKNDFTNLATITSNPANNQWTEVTVTDTGRYRFLRYKGPHNSNGNVAEVQFFAVGSTTPLTGVAFGSSPASSVGKEYDKAFDGNTATFVDSSDGNGYAGIDLGAGNAQQIGKIRFYPRVNNAYKMAPPNPGLTGGQFQGTNETPSSVSVISEVRTSDNRSVSYNYAPFTDPNLPISYQTLTGVDYGNNVQASYTYTQAIPLTHPLMSTAAEPHNAAPYAKVKNTYFAGQYDFLGGVKQQSKVQSNAIIQEFGTLNGGKLVPMVTYGGIRSVSLQMNSGQVQKRNDAMGYSKQYAYDLGGYGFLLATTDAAGRVSKRTPSKYNNPLKTTDALGQVEAVTRDTNDLPLTYKDKLGRTTTYTRDASSRITDVTYPNGSAEHVTYNAYAQPLTRTLPNGAVESHTYDSRGLKTSSTNALGQSALYTYDTADRPVSTTDANGNVTQYDYNTLGQITQMTSADGTATSYAYDDFGNQTTATNELGYSSTTVYDEIRRPVSKTDPLGHTTTYNYSDPAIRKPSLMTYPSGKKVAFVYDANQRLTSQTTGYGSPEASTVTYTYDAVGNMLSNTDPNGGVWSYAYDALNRTTSMTDPLGNTTSYTYDANGNKLTVTRADGGVTTNVYDVMNRLTQTTAPKGQITKMTYDASGNLLTITDPKNNAYSYTYDSLKRKTAMIYPGGSHENWSYDLVGNLATYTNRAGQVCTYTYDSRNRNTAYTWSDGTPGSTKTYDVAGRLLTNSNGVSTLTYTYDNANRALSETQAVSGQPARTVSYTYDADGNRASLTYPGGTSVTYTYDGKNRVTSISADGPPPIATYTYDGNNNRLSKTLENGTAATYSYDAANRLIGISHTTTGQASSFASFNYGYDAVNSRTFVKRGDGLGDAYTYDAIHQISSVKYGATTPDTTPTSPQRSVSYIYDANGNRVSINDNGSAISYTTNALNQYTVFGAAYLGYDTKGNLTSTASWNYTYDAQNRMVGATNGTTSATMAYDARNRCVSRTINGVTTILTYDGWNLIAEYDATGTEQARYIYGTSADELLCMVNAAGPHYYHHDALGNVTQITDVTGAVEEAYSYDVFGAPAITNSTGTTVTTSSMANRFMFTGREYFSELGLYDYRNRVYSSALGRFLQSDPLGFGGGDVNIYRYAANNSTNGTDPTGLVFGILGGMSESGNKIYHDAMDDPANGGSGQDSCDDPDKPYHQTHSRPFNHHHDTVYENGYTVSQPGYGPDISGDNLKLFGERALMNILIGASNFVGLGEAEIAAEGVSAMGDLTAAEIKAIQNVVNQAGRPLEVVGSAAKAGRTAISDIDYVVPPSSLEYFEGLQGELPGIDASHGIIPGVGNPNIGPVIKFEPFTFP